MVQTQPQTQTQTASTKTRTPRGIRQKNAKTRARRNRYGIIMGKKRTE